MFTQVINRLGGSMLSLVNNYAPRLVLNASNEMYGDHVGLSRTIISYHVAFALSHRYFSGSNAPRISWRALCYKLWIRIGVTYYMSIFGIAFIKTYGRLLFSRYLERHRKAINLKSTVVRTTFNDSSMAIRKPLQNHTHPVAAADRSTAVQFIEQVSSSLGLEPYYIQRSRFDEASGRNGSREYFWAKDLDASTKALSPPDNSLLAMVDVDQYIDMNYFLSTVFKPVIIYTFQPTAVARVTSNYSFNFDEHDQVQYTVTGGGQFKHQVWNYSQDNFTVYWYTGPYSYSATTYLVDRRNTSADHDLILLTPLGRWYFTPALIHELILSSPRLQRLRVHTAGFNRLQVSSKDGVSISTGRPHTFLATTVKATVDNALAGLARTSKYVLTLPQVQALVAGPREDSVPLLEFHLSNNDTKPDQVYSVADAVRNYQFYNSQTYNRYDKPSMKGFMKPIVHGCFSPTRDPDNEEECIKSRVTDVRVPPLTISKKLNLYIREFSTLLIPESYCCLPGTHEEVLERQNRPSQRQLYWRSICALPKRIIQMFIKAEAYGNIKAPRPISIINPVDKREYSRYIYGLESVFKRQDWYAFSHTPAEIAARVAHILASANMATPTDFSKFDGHGSNIMRQFERVILLRAFPKEYHSELIDLHQSQFCLEAYGAFGTWYETGFSRASGSPETSLFNTAFNAFIAYVARRELKFTPEQAYAGLGIYGGDDGLTADVPEEVYVRAAKSVGQELTIETIRRGSFGVKFLARIYGPDVWSGDSSSCCDLMRQLSKFHATVNLGTNVTPVQKLTEKVRSFALTDPHTPLIGEFCLKFLMVHGLAFESDATLAMRTWLSKFTADVQYPNGPSQWMHDYLDEIIPNFEVRRFRNWLQGCRHVEDLLSPPCCLEPIEVKAVKPVVVDDTLYPLDQVVVQPRPPPYNREAMKQAVIQGQIYRSAGPNPAYVRMMMDRFPDWKPELYFNILPPDPEPDVVLQGDQPVYEHKHSGPPDGKEVHIEGKAAQPFLAKSRPRKKRKTPVPQLERKRPDNKYDKPSQGDNVSFGPDHGNGPNRIKPTNTSIITNGKKSETAAETTTAKETTASQGERQGQVRPSAPPSDGEAA